MNKRYIIIPFLLCLFLAITYMVSSNQITNEVKEVFNVANLKSNCSIKEKIESNEKYDIKVYYPQTKYDILNNTVNDKIKEYIDYFINEIDGIETLEGVKYKFEIKFDSYEYENYISYVFEIFEDYGGAHPNTSIWTISYNIKKNQLIKIEDLIAKNSHILNFLSEYSFNELKNNKEIKENYIEELLVSGTKPVKENFSNFAFDKDGFKIFFQKYSVAPYSSGAFVVNVPYSKLDIN